MKKTITFFLILLTACTMNSGNKQKEKQYEWFASGNAPLLYPAELFFGDFLFSDEKRLYIPESIPFATTWGRSVSMHVLNNNIYPAPDSIDIIWLSLAENQFYSLKTALPKDKIRNLLAEIHEETKKQKYYFIIVGMAPYGGLAVWLSGKGITTDVAWLQAEPIDVEMEDFAPTVEYTQKEYRDLVFKDCKEAYENFQKNGLPDRMLFERYMQKFNYRISPKFENEKAVFEGISMYYYNGELNTTNSGEHASNAMRAKPYKIVINWRIGKDKFGGYFWTDEKKIIDIFSDFYANNAQKEGNLIIEIGESGEQFKFSLQNENSTVEIPIEDLQIMVFKNRFEMFRSSNYDKPEGSWRD